jgi:hypothetical protein
MRPITEEIRALREMRVPELVARYQQVFGKPPRVKHREWLWKRIAWKIQEQRFGGLSDVAKQRIDDLIADMDLPLGDDRRTVAGTLRGPVKAEGPPAGTTLVRRWHGQDVHVRVVDGGYEHDGVVHRSLSAAARAITGSHWNGRLFFGLSKRKAAH